MTESLPLSALSDAEISALRSNLGVDGWSASVVGRLFATIDALQRSTRINRLEVVPEVSDADLEAVESAVGMGKAAWDCVKAKDIVAAAWHRLAALRSSADGPLYCPPEYLTATGVFEASDPEPDSCLNTHCAGCGCEQSQHLTAAALEAQARDMVLLEVTEGLVKRCGCLGTGVKMGRQGHQAKCEDPLCAKAREAIARYRGRR